MSKIPIALQLYSVRDECQEDFLDVIRKVGEMGYQGVEFAGFHGRTAGEVRSALDAAGLACAGSHTGIAALADESFDATLDYLAEVGCPYVIVPGIPEEMRSTPHACADTARRFSDLCARIEERGIRAGYHCHYGDMVQLADGRTAWYILGSMTPRSFVLQYDTANGMSAGSDPVQPIRDWPGRGETIHLKEWAGRHGAAPIGEGDVPWTEVFAACEQLGGTVWYIVEHEGESNLPSLEAAQRCLSNLRAMGK